MLMIWIMCWSPFTRLFNSVSSGEDGKGGRGLYLGTEVPQCSPWYSHAATVEQHYSGSCEKEKAFLIPALSMLIILAAPVHVSDNHTRNSKTTNPLHRSPGTPPGHPTGGERQNRPHFSFAAPFTSSPQHQQTRLVWVSDDWKVLCQRKGERRGEPSGSINYTTKIFKNKSV